MKNSKQCRIVLRAVSLIFLTSVFLLAASADTLQQRGNIDSLIIEKTFPFFNYAAHNKAFAEALRKDAVLKNQGIQHRKRVETALQQCADVSCYADAVQWTPEEAGTIGNRLKLIVAKNKKMQSLPALLRSGRHYTVYETKADSELMESVWNDAALGVNRILDTYIKGKKPRYPAIDAISFQAGDAEFRQKIRRELNELVRQHASKDLFFELPLQSALRALAMNGRDEAARYEPLNEGMNKTAVAGIPAIQWSSFPYSLILVPGQGPEQEGVAIDPMSIQRCRLAAERYRKGLAPLIVVSGGHVHPNKTPYSEAVEMKKYMVKELNIPESAILIDPHARHTTTNMRNAARMVYRFGIPESKKILTVSDPNQSSFIPRMEKRFLDELGYLPYREMKVLSPEENEFYPVKEALQANPLDPLDP